jgi:hypothetical protein
MHVSNEKERKFLTETSSPSGVKKLNVTRNDGGATDRGTEKNRSHVFVTRDVDRDIVGKRPRGRDEASGVPRSASAGSDRRRRRKCGSTRDDRGDFE